MLSLRYQASFFSCSAALILCAGVLPAVAPAQSKEGSAPAQPQALEEVTVTAVKQSDERTLDRVIIPRFVASHGVPNPYSHQLGRWRSPGAICPSTVGLRPAFADYVSHRILSVAASVGAPTAVYGHCKATVEVIFTPDPQEQVNYFSKHYRALLGYDGDMSEKDLLTFSQQIRAWYTTATLTFGNSWVVDKDPPVGVVNAQERGSASRISAGTLSGFVNVLVIADARRVSEHSLGSIADYIAMLVLTRASTGGCSELPSIIDLLSSGCTGRPPPDAITAADTAYLKALYSADLGKNLNLERGDMHDRMSREVLDKQAQDGRRPAPP